MPRSDLRRCAFKIHKNDKYQCQKAGDKLQPAIRLWYCKFHDCHAQDRCQVLVTWAGKGAQCDQLGYLDGDGSKKLCALHAVKSKDDSCPQMQGPIHVPELVAYSPPFQGVDISATEQDMITFIPLSAVPSFSTAENTTQAPFFASISPPDNEYPDIVNNDLVKDDSLSNNEAHSPATLKIEIPTLIAAQEETVSTPTSLLDKETIDAWNTSLAALYQTVVDAPTPITDPNSPCNVGQARRKRIDSLFPTPPASPTSPSPTASSTSPHSVQATYQDVIHALTTTHFHSPQTPIDSPISPSTPSCTRNAALYAQCSVCLEKHGEYNMRRVEACGHQYRELCVRKAIKTGGLRRFNCVSCRVWMGGVTQGEVGVC